MEHFAEKARVLKPAEKPEPQHGGERHARPADGGTVLWPREKAAAVVDGDGEEHEQQKPWPAAGIEGETEGEQDEIARPAVPVRYDKIENEQAGEKENKKADTAEDHGKISSRESNSL